MAIKVAILGGETNFEGHRLTEWLARHLALPRKLARAVARASEAELLAAGTTVIQAPELQLVASRLAAKLSFQSGMLVGFSGPNKLKHFTEIGPFVGPALDDAGALGEMLKEGGFVPDGDGYYRKETLGFPIIGDDSQAPRISQVTVEPGPIPSDIKDPCCTTQMGSRGVPLTIMVKVTDTGGFGNSSGVTTMTVCAYGVDAAGRVVPGPCATKELTEEEADRSEDEDVEVTLTLCVACSHIETNTINLSIRVTDDDDNERICLRRVDVPEPLMRRCC